jgi:hypothetical protein
MERSRIEVEEWEEPLHPDPVTRTVIPLPPTKQP